MNNRRKKSSNNRKEVKKDKIIRCKSKMIPVFENDNCEGFIKNEKAESSNIICKNCEYSF